MNHLRRFTHRNGLRACTLALTVAWVVVGCGESTGGTATAAAPSTKPAAAKTAALPLPRACTLISEVEAKTLLGQEVSRMDDSAENCMWASAGSPGRFTMLMVQPMQADSVADAQTQFEVLVDGLDALNKTINDSTRQRTRKSGVNIDGLGDQAWRTASNVDVVSTQRLIARKGTRLLVVNITGMARAEGVGERLESFTKTAIAKL